MSAATVLRCDAEACTASVEGGAGEAWWVNLRAESEGWVTGDAGDFCPAHLRGGVA
ncbi:hypothetical protein SAMN05216506_113176 [Saccharopolyspora kobensis]|uniref:Uncharacterized protein n=1 Tax=Saccharopolyspora kobensis TaxID=146035 RepID=A0ABY1E4J8_9PSEU|nr:hypothetical protein [Saccharopolyspora kobensis]SFE69540.1 hypothetical protein SAMN05216506_113176 [Saccharopolyspora kobensis]